MAYGTRSDEEEKRRREAFEKNKAKLAFGEGSQASGFMGAGNLAAKAPQPKPQLTTGRQSPQLATRNAAAEREQALAQRRQLQANQKANQAASMQNTRRDIQEILKLPAKEQPQAVQRLRQNSPAQPQARSSASLGMTPVLAATTNQPEERLTELGGGVKKPAANAKIQLDFPIKKQSRGEDQWNPRDYPSVYAGKQPDSATPIAETYVESQPSERTPEPVGFNPVNNTASSGRSNPGIGFRMPRPPGRTWSERQEREALLRDVSTPYKGAQNGQLTARQMELRAGIVGANDKYKNDQYGAQLGAASQLAQTQMTQAGANERAMLGEENANNRFNSQLGFDAGKFQQTAEQQQQANNLASRRLDIEQSNSDVANFAPKQLNALYEKYEAAQSDEDRSAIAAQIQALKGTKSDKEYWTNIGGGETLSADGLTSIKNPDILLNRNTGDIARLPAEPIDYETDPRAQAIINDRSLSKDERRKQLEALR